MANYKVVFRSDNANATSAPGWEPGCPLLINAVQVSRNTDSGQCYLQLKLSNISGEVVNSYELKADVTYADGTTETVELRPLDADIAPGKIYRPDPVALAGSEVANVTARIGATSQAGGRWQSTETPGAIPAGELVALEGPAAIERSRTFTDLGKSPERYQRRLVEGDTWWVCPCGMPNAGRATCCACGISHDTLCQLEDESALNAKTAERAAAEKERTRKKRRTVKILSAVGIAALAAVAILVNQFVIQPQMEIQALPACYVPSLTTYYDENGEVSATVSYNADERGALSEKQTVNSSTSTTTTASFSPNEVGFPLSIVESEQGEEGGASNQTAAVSINETTEDGLPLRVTVTSDERGTSILLLDYYPDGTLKSSKRESGGRSSITTYNEHGFPQEITVTNADGEITTTTYSYSEENSSMPSSYTGRRENADGSSLEQTWSLEYDSNGNLYQIYADGVLLSEYTYTRIDHTAPWIYVIAHTKPFCGVLAGLSY